MKYTAIDDENIAADQNHVSKYERSVRLFLRVLGFTSWHPVSNIDIHLAFPLIRNGFVQCPMNGVDEQVLKWFDAEICGMS